MGQIPLYLIQTLDESMDPDLVILSRNLGSEFEAFITLYVDSWASLHVNMLNRFGV